MLDYLAYGAIGIAMATTILTFRLLTSEQKKEHPNESILKMIKWFMGLTVFFSVFFGVIEIFKGAETEMKDKTVSETITQLKAQSNALTLERNEKGDFLVTLEDTEGVQHELGALTNRSFGIVKEKSAKNAWYANLGMTKLGQISSAWNLWDLRSDDGTYAYLKQWYPIDKANSKLEFMIESIKLINASEQGHGSYEFLVKFNERDAKGQLTSSSELCPIYSTPDGVINPFSFIPLNNSEWKNEYYAGIGFGQPTKQSNESIAPKGTPVEGVAWNRVQRFNGAVIQMNLKNK